MRKQLVGTVLSVKMYKTIVVEVEGLKTHRIYKKQIRQQKKYYVHDEEQKAQEGDQVVIEEARPMSKTKRWKLVKIIEK